MRSTSAGAVMLAVVLCASIAGAATLSVDFGVSDTPPGGASPNDVQTGFFDFSVPFALLAGDDRGADAASVTTNIPASFGTNGTIDVTVTGTVLPTFWRDRSVTVTHALGDLVEDFVGGGGASGSMLLTLSGLHAGIYTITTYHHEPKFPASTIGIASVRVANGANPTRTVSGAVTGSDGTAPATISTVTFSFFADGVNDVVVTFVSTSSWSPVLNGFELEEIIPDNIQVDYGVSDAGGGSTPNDLQSGHIGFDVPFDVATGDDRGANVPSVTNTIWTTLATDQTVRVVVAGATLDTFWRDRTGTHTNTLGDLAEEFVASGGDLVLTLSGLRPGLYTMTTYHHDETYTTPAFNADTSVGIESISVTSAGNPPITVVSDDILSAPRDDPPNFGTFQFSASGGRDVVVTFEDRVGGNPVLNGFTVDVIKFYAKGTVVVLK